MITPDLVVTRHEGAIYWLRRHLVPHEHEATVEIHDGRHLALVWRYFGVEPGSAEWDDSENAPACYRWVPVHSSVTADDVRGKHVVGNLPLHLAALCASVTAIEFEGAPPRGTEYTREEMERAGARLVRYTVVAA